MAIQRVGVDNASEVRINPATAEGQASLLEAVAAAGGYLVQTAEGKQAGDDAAHAITLAAGTTHVRLVSTGGVSRFELGNTADANSPPLPEDAPEWLAIKGGTSTLSVYVPTGSTLHYQVFTATAR